MRNSWHPWLGACAQRIAAASPGAKASFSLATDRVDHAAWPRPSPRAPLLRTKPPGFTVRLRTRHPSLIASEQNPNVRGKLLAAALGALLAATVLVPTSLGESIAQSLMGRGLVRAEIVVKRDSAILVYRVDRGRVRAFNRSSLTLRELDGTIVVVPISPATRFELGPRVVGLNALRRGMNATTTRVGDAPAERVQLAPR
jgi:hypothetical protein